VVALLTRSLGQRKANKRLDTFTVPVRVQPAGRINQTKNWPKDGLVSITYRGNGAAPMFELGFLQGG
jgi:hypothetical protein